MQNMDSYSKTAMERAMKVQEVILRALAKKVTWWQAAEIIGISEARPHVWPVRIGAMIEVPAAALLAHQLAESAEFFSIGTNDLTQYVLAAERGNGELATLQDALHPSVLRLIQFVVEGAKSCGRHVSICGDAASDPVAAAIFMGLGVHSLSVRPNQVAEVKALFRRVVCSGTEELAAEALGARDAAQARELATRFLERRP
jgi:multiphosphoryl transfer protein